MSSRSRKKKSRVLKKRGNVGPFKDDDFNGKYKWVRKLGKGSYGFVCEATPTGPSEHQRVAIKKVVRIFNNPIEARRMLRELRLLRKLNACEHIVGLIDILPPKNLENFDSLNIVLEYVATDLGKLIPSEQYWNETHVTWILHQILLGVKFMHSAKICHRDLKPANILITENTSVRICDFGLARSWMVNKDHKPNPQSKGRLSLGSTSPGLQIHKAVGPTEQKRQSNKDHVNRTPTHHVVTRWYRSPEVILLQQDWEHMGAIDMWSVGCIMAELMNMSEGNCSMVKKRKALFPGSSSYPLSPYSENNKQLVQNRDQLKMIFRIIGTPKEDEIEGFNNEEVKKYLGKFSYKPAKDFRSLFPVSPVHHVDLLKNLITFDRRKRFTVEQALAHRALRDRRNVNLELTCEPEVFEFEDLKLDISTLHQLVVDEVLLYNLDLAGKYGLKRSISRQTLVPRPSFRGSLPLDALDLNLCLDECKGLQPEQDEMNIMQEDENLVPPKPISSQPRSEENGARDSTRAIESPESFPHASDKLQNCSPTTAKEEEHEKELTPSLI